MKIEGEHVFKGPREAVWEMFYDPQVLASAIPGMDKLDQISENEFRGVMNLRIGPVSGKFEGKLSLTDVVPPESLTLTVDGRGGPGFAKGVGKVNLVEQEGDETVLKYAGDVNIGGALASVGQRMIDSVSKSMIRQAFDILDKNLEARLAAKDSGSEVVNFTPPSQTELAAGVAKDVVGGFTKIAEVRMLIYVVSLVAVLLAVMFIVKACSG